MSLFQHNNSNSLLTERLDHKLTLRKIKLEKHIFESHSSNFDCKIYSSSKSVELQLNSIWSEILIDMSMNTITNSTNDNLRIVKEQIANSAIYLDAIRRSFINQISLSFIYIDRTETIDTFIYYYSSIILTIIDSNSNKLDLTILSNAIIQLFLFSLNNLSIFVFLNKGLKVIIDANKPFIGYERDSFMALCNIFDLITKTIRLNILNISNITSLSSKLLSTINICLFNIIDINFIPVSKIVIISAYALDLLINMNERLILDELLSSKVLDNVSINYSNFFLMESKSNRNNYNSYFLDYMLNVLLIISSNKHAANAYMNKDYSILLLIQLQKTEKQLIGVTKILPYFQKFYNIIINLLEKSDYKIILMISNNEQLLNLIHDHWKQGDNSQVRLLTTKLFYHFSSFLCENGIVALYFNNTINLLYNQFKKEFSIDTRIFILLTLFNFLLNYKITQNHFTEFILSKMVNDNEFNKALFELKMQINKKSIKDEYEEIIQKTENIFHFYDDYQIAYLSN